ncbi:hypothetical protein A3C09_03665 [Candidatus Uhrbacteria bacterium RIFCSPHIGHO2_02_FULL_47_44]|uniref:Uncharacterized protein n=1 Tax=Candidatus Uhrbacteria bacterium RIFCSPLOWO2_02_FULL_48_18 TaxID=1802408 RepID=A0A1F7V841_9BACT|nr:MAG: hypothetical protein A2839_04815 [Candidatus Uhrbacteria bacterium RIFCSPHIGHO2_01_FULL_47_10]OGL71304.1 MAG: hypothetical protein A3C09_03665 [Candidatus Uhrbacteria bacterium RIFCSPHIGHO2_02_FULL_47_44]OGL77613.1 MAG: hypothetical protein A3E97_05045 [Candidatus Uhrbacteria bacterium RIFCSPHIGHO2_12_FULL_47_12]OGL80397.1 MAG: hypothetical protein A3B20_03210 [Candidatus Uhrbacteria bacterium RIFCSPLOWO2_01_FULL_47_17]OGL86257.1 MAG: hypothetical protein A3I41_01695 [Candidatus Uhrbact
MKKIVNALRVVGSVSVGTLGVAVGVCGLPFMVISLPVAMLVAKQLPDDDDMHIDVDEESESADAQKAINTLSEMLYGGLIFGVLLIPLAPAGLCFTAASHLWPNTET